MVDLPATYAAVLVFNSIVLRDVSLTVGAQFKPPPIGSLKLPLGCTVVTVVDSIVLSDV